MAKLPKKFVDRVKANIKECKKLVLDTKDRDAHEADTVTVVKEILANIFGYDKFRELTSEQQIKGTFCDLSIKIDDKVRFLIEIKSADSNLNDNHIRQAVNYGLHHNIEWVGLTNSVEWHLYKIKFEQPVGYERVTSFNLSDINVKDEANLEKLFLLAREGLSSNAIHDYHQTSLVLNKFTVAQIIQSENIISAIRRDFRKVFPDVKISTDDISEIIQNEIFKREVIEGEKAKEAQSRIKKSISKAARSERKQAKQKEVTSQDNTALETDAA